MDDAEPGYFASIKEGTGWHGIGEGKEEKIPNWSEPEVEEFVQAIDDLKTEDFSRGRNGEGPWENDA